MSRFRNLFVSGAAIAALMLPIVACDNGPSIEDNPIVTAPITSPVTESFASQLFVGGSASRTFTAAKAGTATITLVSAGPPTTVKLGFGIGVPDALGSGCLFTRSAEAAVAGTSFSLPVDAGTYCVRVYDTGTLTANTAFAITIVRP